MLKIKKKDSDAYRSARRVRCAQNQAKEKQKQDHNFAGFRFQHAKALGVDWNFALTSEFGCIYRQYLRAAEYLFSRYFLFIIILKFLYNCNMIYNIYILNMRRDIL